MYNESAGDVPGIDCLPKRLRLFRHGVGGYGWGTQPEIHGVILGLWLGHFWHGGGQVFDLHKIMCELNGKTMAF